MKTHLKYLLGLVFMVFVFGGCQDPSRLEIPDGATVEFVWGTDPQVNTTCDNKTFNAKVSMYLLGLESDQNNNYYYSYPKGHEDKYKDFPNTDEEYFKKLCEDEFKKAFGTKYYKEGTQIPLTKWTRQAKDLITKDYYSQFYFLAEDVRKEDYETDKIYLAYLKENSFDEIEVRNENIRIYVYWNYALLQNN